MMTYLEMFLFKVILGWLDTHPPGKACNEAIAKKLAQRIETRLDRAGMITKDGGKPYGKDILNHINGFNAHKIKI